MEIQRDIIEELKTWKNSRYRKPLVLQGARQVGKSWVLKKFGELCFANTVYFNFDLQNSLREDFKKTKEPTQLLRSLSLSSRAKIEPEKTLIIFDEIQECNEALNSLKYFQEMAPEYVIVCAGSLLGVALNRNNMSFPVGKVDFLNMYPVTFSEFLRTVDAPLYDIYKQLDLKESIPEVVHLDLLQLYKTYLAVGGMPEAVCRYAETYDWELVNKVQDAILSAYSMDFSKHIANKDIPRVFQVWGNLQDQLAREDKKFRYADVNHGARAREYEAAIEWLSLSGLINLVWATETPRLPLSAYKKSTAFKLYLADVGLLCRKFNLDDSTVIEGNQLFTEFKGALSENYILQSLTNQLGNNAIYYWTSGNTAEVEFVIQSKNNIIPIEVKADKNITAKSLALYRKTYQPQLSIRFSTRNIHKDADLLNLPLYMVDRLSEIL